MAEDSVPVKETITLTSDKVASETFTETAAGNGMFYSDKNKVAFIAAGTAENPYYITEADDTHPNAADISLSYGSGCTVTVGGFTGDSHLAIGDGENSVREYTENSLFIGGYGWHGTTPRLPATPAAKFPLRLMKVPSLSIKVLSGYRNRYERLGRRTDLHRPRR